MLGIRCVIIFLTLIASVSGSLYPTFPIASTTWSGGRTECVTWIDDGSPPHLQDLGRMDLELFVNGKVRRLVFCNISSRVELSLWFWFWCLDACRDARDERKPGQ